MYRTVPKPSKTVFYGPSCDFSAHQISEHHGTVHPGVGMLPVEVLIHFGLSSEVLPWVPVLREVVLAT